MRTLSLILATIFALSHITYGQDTIYIDDSGKLLNTSIANQFTIYECSPENDNPFFYKSNYLSKRKLSHSVENLDFTSSIFFIEFVIVNNSTRTRSLVLETARPITNEVSLYSHSQGIPNAFSGDNIPFEQKTVQSNKSLLPISLPPGSTSHHTLKLLSDGEIISLPMIFWESKVLQEMEQKRQFSSGIFYGIFVFVIIIYLSFYVLLKDKLFLLYTVYVFFSGMLQFALDGYVHQYIFTSGGYWTQHAVIVIAGLTVFFALNYAQRYLELEGRIKKITLGFSWLVFLTLLLSLIPGKIYEACYPLINGFSFLAVAFLIIVAVRIRQKNPKISRLFLIGLFTLMVGAVIFILGNFSIIDTPWLTQNSLKAGTLVEIICLSILMAGKYKSLQEEKEEAQKLLLVELEEKNRLVSKTNIRLEKEVKERTIEIETQRKLLKEKNEDFMASVKYAERIQTAVLSNEQKFKSILPDSFVIFQPKDIVSGDFYWIEKIPPSSEWPEGLVVYATADCTGHGVPGAFVSIICNNLLKLGKTHPQVQTPGQALDFVNAEINETLNSEYSDEQIRDGMDIALCAIDQKNKVLHFSGAKNGVYIIREEELIELKADRHGIGYTDNEDIHFVTQTLQLEQGDVLYTFSDGFIDQFGGSKGKKFTSRRLKELLISIAKAPMNHQQSTLENAFDIWKDEEEQLDDVLLIGVRIE